MGGCVCVCARAIVHVLMSTLSWPMCVHKIWKEVQLLARRELFIAEL